VAVASHLRNIFLSGPRELLIRPSAR